MLWAIEVIGDGASETDDDRSGNVVDVCRCNGVAVDEHEEPGTDGDEFKLPILAFELLPLPLL